ncbi:hypothetical protein PMAYCL1PPCAC_08443, partial [Pristionchus mayeri]
EWIHGEFFNDDHVCEIDISERAKHGILHCSGNDADVVRSSTGMEPTELQQYLAFVYASAVDLVQSITSIPVNRLQLPTCRWEVIRLQKSLQMETFERSCKPR